jgi:hypothetical protein
VSAEPSKRAIRDLVEQGVLADTVGVTRFDLEYGLGGFRTRRA